MKLFADENVPKLSVTRLRQEGYQVTYVVEQTRKIRDLTILQIAQKENSLILTLDKDFEKLVLQEKRASFGVVWIGLARLKNQVQEAERLTQVLNHYGESLFQSFTVITTGNVDIQPLDLTQKPTTNEWSV